MAVYVCFFFSLCFCSVVSLSFRVLHIFLCIFRVLYEVWCICLCSKLWFLTSRVWIETLRSSVVCGARFCKVFLFFVFFFGLFSFVCLFVPLNAFHTKILRTDHYCYFLRAIDANFCIVYKSSICMFFLKKKTIYLWIHCHDIDRISTKIISLEKLFVYLQNESAQNLWLCISTWTSSNDQQVTPKLMCIRK